MPVDSIGNYNSILDELKKRQQAIQSQQPETASDLNDQMIENAKNELRMQQAIKTEAKAREIAKENHENPNADFAMSKSEVEKAKEIEDLTDKNKNGIPDELEASPEAVKPPISVPNKQVVPAVAEAPQDEIKPVLDPLAEAKRQRTAQEAYADIVEGLTRAGAGLGGAGLTQIKPDLSMADRMRKEGERGYTETEARLKLEQAQKLAEAKAQREAEALKRQERLDRLNETYKIAQISKLKTELNKKGADLSADPNSDASKLAQEKLKRLGVQEDLSLFSEADIQGNLRSLIPKATKQIELEREKRLGEKFGFQKTEKYSDDARNALKDMRQTESWKNAEKSLAEIPNIEVLLDDAYKKGGQSLAMLGPKIAKGIAGEVGVLTEQDVTRYVQNPSLVGGYMDTIKKAKSGQITQASYENIKRLLEIAKKTNQAKLDAAIDREATIFSRREGITKDEAREFLDSGFSKEAVKKATETKAPYGDEVERNGKTYKWNPTVGKYQLKG